MRHLPYSVLDGHEVVISVEIRVLGLEIVFQHNDKLIPRLVDELSIYNGGVPGVEQDHAVDESVDDKVVLHQRFD